MCIQKRCFVFYIFIEHTLLQIKMKLCPTS